MLFPCISLDLSVKYTNFDTLRILVGEGMNEASQRPPKTIGRAERVDFPELSLSKIPARIDTGAKTSALWASEATQKDGKLQVVLFDENSPFYTGKLLVFDDFETVAVASSNGSIQERYKIKTIVKLKDRKIRAAFTLADRASQVYPVLVGRNVLLGKFIVDVKHGHILKGAEKKRSEIIQSSIMDKAEEK